MADLKLYNIILGLTSCSSKHGCCYCKGKKGPDGVWLKGEDRTLENLLEDLFWVQAQLQPPKQDNFGFWWGNLGWNCPFQFCKYLKNKYVSFLYKQMTCILTKFLLFYLLIWASNYNTHLPNGPRLLARLLFCVPSAMAKCVQSNSVWPIVSN